MTTTLVDKYSKASRDLIFSQRAYNTATLLFLAACLSGAAFTGGIAGAPDNLIVISILGAIVAFFSAGFVFFYRRSKAREPGDALIPAIHVYDAYHAVKEALITNSRKEERNKAIEKLQELALMFEEGLNAPLPPQIVYPLESLTNAIHQKLIPTVKTGDNINLEKVANSLQRLLIIFDTNAEWSEMVSIVNELNSFSVQTYEQPQLSVKSKIRTKHSYMISISVAVAVGASFAAIVYFISGQPVSGVVAGATVTVGVAAFIDRRLVK